MVICVPPALLACTTLLCCSKNGQHLGTAFRSVTGHPLFPTIGLHRWVGGWVGLLAERVHASSVPAAVPAAAANSLDGGALLLLMLLLRTALNPAPCLAPSPSSCLQPGRLPGGQLWAGGLPVGPCFPGAAGAGATGRGVEQVRRGGLQGRGAAAGRCLRVVLVSCGVQPARVGSSCGAGMSPPSCFRCASVMNLPPGLPAALALQHACVCG